jgi:hypothetical protein
MKLSRRAGSNAVVSGHRLEIWVCMVVACGVDVPVATDASGGDASTTTTGWMGASETSSGDEMAANSSGHGEATTRGDELGDGADGPKLDLEVPETTGVSDDCAEVAKDILVLATNETISPAPVELHRFVMETATFELVVILPDESCAVLNEVSDADHTMAVDRDGLALTPSPTGLFAIDLTLEAPTCDPLEIEDAFDTPPGLAFAGTAPEQLFALDDGLQGGAFGRLDPSVMPVTFEQIASTTYHGGILAGTADERLFSIVRTDGPTGELVRLSPDDASIVESYTVLDDASQHLAFYGGDLILFDATHLGDDEFIPTVRRFDLDDDDGNGMHELDALVETGDGPPGLRIRGVASSTCVPLTPAG